MRKIAYYLPQFHRVKENDEWWGEGFTEWTNVRKASCLFENHYQPHIPLDDNYYSLDEKKTVEWQTKLANDYGVYGFAYYHYWFEGRLLLEKPVENLLKWKDINQKYFFFWANHDWIKSVEGKQEILMKQNYGDVKDWDKHYNYFLPYFKDDRYIKVDNKPVVGIYILKNIPNVKEMINYWNKKAISDGFNGVYIIESTNVIDSTLIDFNSGSDALVLRQPNAAADKMTKWYARIRKHPKIQQMIKKFYPYKVPYGRICKEVIRTSKQFKPEKKVYYGVFCGWDNTSRHSSRGWVATDINAKDFRETIVELEKLGETEDFLFINAWNEWAEGMHLEPDKKNKYTFLQAIND